MNPYETKAGAIIASVQLTGVNSDLPEQLIAQVRELFFDTETSPQLLIPRWRDRPRRKGQGYRD